LWKKLVPMKTTNSRGTVGECNTRKFPHKRARGMQDTRKGKR